MILGYFGADDDEAVPGVPGAIVGPASNITPEMIVAAKKWGSYYQMPPAWILATIIAESNGNPKVVGDYHVDPNGASIGLMQVNTIAEAPKLRKARVTREMLKIPAINIQWGTMILRRKYDQVLEALAKARNKAVSNAISRKPELLGELVRLLYTGVDVIRHIYRGTLPDAKKVAPTVGGWRRNLVAVAPLAPETVALAPGGVMGFGRAPARAPMRMAPRLSPFYDRRQPPRSARRLHLVSRAVYAPPAPIAVVVTSGDDDCATYPTPLECRNGTVYWKSSQTLCCRSD